MRFPMAHIADSTISRIMRAAQAIEKTANPPQMPAPASDPAQVPPITQAPIDLGATLQGADAFDSIMASLK